MSLTIGKIAGIINVGVAILQLTFPLLLTYILVGIVPARSNAVTWSVTGRFLHGSWWPTILRTDTAATSKVSKRVIILSYFATLGLILLAAAAVVTPLGLYDTITAKNSQVSRFVYANDVSPIGQATLPRDDYNTSRICGAFAYMSCPGQDHGFYTTTNASGSYINWDSDSSYISTVVPDNLTALFSTGRTGDRATVATPFDIEYRYYTLISDVKRQQSLLLNTTVPDYQIDMYAKRTKGEMQYGNMIILADDFVISDGIIADMKKGGLGFRNHTIPASVYSGVNWTEGLLWLEPETVCINNNVTIQFGIKNDDTGNSATYIIDDGGLTTKPNYPYIDLNDTQNHPNLYDRAHKGAVLMNFNLRQMLKISSANASYSGKRFNLSGTYYKPGVLNIGTFDNLIPGAYMTVDPSANITLMDSIGLVTTGYGGLDTANFSHIANIGGAVLGAFTNIDPNNHNGRYDPGTNYSAPLFSCSTSVRAFIMDVTFSMNGTSSLSNLRVESATPRTYSSNATTPLWAVENTGGMNISDVQPIWGLVGDELEHDPRLWTIRRDHMYLPAGSSAMSFGSLYSGDSLGCGAPVNTLDVLYNGLSTTMSDLPDYSGEFSLPTRQKWQKLSKSKEGIATMMALMWTDLTANYITSSRGQLNANLSSVTTYVQRAAQKIPTSQPMQVITYERVIRYHVPYAIVALAFLAVYVAVLVVAIGMCVSRRSTIFLLRSLLNQTSVGRAVTVERYKDDGGLGVQARSVGAGEWVREFGGQDVSIVKERKKGKASGGLMSGEAQEYKPVPRSGSPSLVGKK